MKTSKILRCPLDLHFVLLPLTDQPPTATRKLDLSFPDGTLEWLLELFNQLGDIFCLLTREGKSVYVVSNPDYVKHVLVANHCNYTKGVGIDRVKILLGNGLMASEGDFWQRQRKLVQPAFHKTVLSGMLEAIRDCNLTLIDRWRQSQVANTSVDITEETSNLTLRIVLDALFGDQIGRAFETGSANPFSVLTDEPERNLQFAYKFRGLGKQLQQWIEQRRECSSPRQDLLALMMQARDRQSGEPMTDKQLIDEAMTLIVAGHETTASALNWLWYLVSQHPEVERTLHDEIDATELPVDLQLDDLNRFTYTRQVIAETLRLYPPGWLLTRRAIGEDRIGNYRVPAGSDVFISPYLVHRHPDLWNELDAFRPERFDTPQSHRYASIPFAAGPRACIGEQFALAEMTLHVAMVARRFRLCYVPGQPIAVEAQVNLRTRNNLWMRVIPRNSH